jgi:hypothetical protein
MSTTPTAPNPDNDRPRRQALGLVVLLLTLGAGYGVARLEVRAPVVLAETAELEEAEAEDEQREPSIAEIMAEIETVATRHRVPPRLVAAIVAVESEFNPRAVSRRGAQGLMQLMPATAASVDVQDSFDARENIEGGVRHLRALMDRYRNDLPVVLAAYNAGDRAVLAHQGIPPYRETRQYVIRVLRRFDREAAQAAARRIYGPGPGGRRGASIVNTRLVSFQGPMPAVVRYRYQDDVLGERAPVVPPAPPVPPVTAVPAMQGGPAMRAVPAQPGPPRRAENP